MIVSRKLYLSFIAVVAFASCWLLYFLLLAANLPLLQKIFRMVADDGGWQSIVRHEHGLKLITMVVVMIIAGNVAWLVSKLFERRFVEIWTKKS